MPNKGWIRLAWAFFENEAAADKVLASLATQKVRDHLMPSVGCTESDRSIDLLTLATLRSVSI